MINNTPWRTRAPQIGMLARRTAGTMTIVGLALIVVAAFVGASATPAAADDKDDDSTVTTPVGDTTTTTVDDKDTTTTTVDDKDTTTTTVDDKDTTTTTVDTTTTSAPERKLRAQIEGTCTYDGGAASYVVTVTITGPAGGAGSVTLDGGANYPFSVDGSGTTTVTAVAHAGTNAVLVKSTAGEVVAAAELTLNDCTPDSIETTAHASAICRDGMAFAAVSIQGAPGATGTVSVDGSTTGFTLDASGVADVTLQAAFATMTVTVTDGDGTTVLGPQVLVAENCAPEDTTTTTAPPSTTVPTTGPTTTTQPKQPHTATGASSSGQCVVSDTVTYSISVVVVGDPGATGIIGIGDLHYEYLIYDQGQHMLTVPAAPGDTAIVVSDDIAGEVHSSTVSIEDCQDTEVLGTSTGGENVTTPDVAVLGSQVELPFTGPADGPLAAVGAALVAAGAVILLATGNRREDDHIMDAGWNVLG